VTCAYQDNMSISFHAHRCMLTQRVVQVTPEGEFERHEFVNEITYPNATVNSALRDNAIERGRRGGKVAVYAHL
jgi:hypothetical protein